MSNASDAEWVVRTPARFGFGALVEHVRETWRSRSILAVLTQRELKGRYSGSLLGFGWTLLNPLLLLGVYSLVFSIYLRIDVPHYPLFVLSGLLPWLWLSQSLASGATSLMQGGMLITKVLFPPQVLPAVQLASNGLHFLLGLPIVYGLSVWFGDPAGWTLLALPFVIVAQALFLLGFVLALSSTCVLFRDVQFIVGNLVTFWFFLTPIAYPASLIPEWARWVLVVNPFAPFATAYQDILYRGDLPSPRTWALMGAWAVVSVIAGTLLFERVRPHLVEEL